MLPRNNLMICDSFLHFTVIIEACVIFRRYNTIKHFLQYAIFYSLLSIVPCPIRQNIYLSIKTEAYAGLSQRSKMEFFVNIRNYLKLFTIFSSSFILEVWLGSKYASDVCFSRVIFNKID